MHTTSRILIAIVIILVVSNVVTAVGWGIAAGKIPQIAGLSALAGPNAQSPGAEFDSNGKFDSKSDSKSDGKSNGKSKGKPVDPDDDSSPSPRGDNAVAPVGDQDDDSGGFMDSVENAFSNLKSAVMLH